jgi:hypothetical protein
MSPTHAIRKISVQASAIALALGLTACAASQPSIEEAAVADDAAFATCRTASITVDSRTRYQAPIAGFLEQARTSGCAYGAIQIADATPESKSQAEDHLDAVEVARDFIDAFELSWRLQPETVDPELSANTLRVTVLAPGDADRAVATAQEPDARYR